MLGARGRHHTGRRELLRGGVVDFQRVDRNAGAVAAGNQHAAVGQQRRRQVCIAEATLGVTAQPQGLGQPPDLAAFDRIAFRASQDLDRAWITDMEQRFTDEGATINRLAMMKSPLTF